MPGYNFAIANTSRPLDAAAAASLATSGVFAPLLLTDDAADLPRPLESYLLSVQPGYEDDPGQAVYNRAWILGDDDAISVEEQARIDAITELIPVQRERAVAVAGSRARMSEYERPDRLHARADASRTCAS